jgi:hypothetical protein
MSGRVESKEIHEKSALEDFEQSGEGRPAFILTYTEVKLLGIAGVSAVSVVPASTSDLSLRWAFSWTVGI